MKLHRAAPFLRAYGLLPHRLLNGAALHLSRARRPRAIVDAVIRAWVRRGAIDLRDYEERDYGCVEDFFLRRLRPGARPIGAGVVSPVDGVVVDAGALRVGHELLVKGRPISFDRLIGGASAADRARYQGGQYAVVFLSPDGYHRIHAPADGSVTEVRSIGGRFFPQNDDALRHIDRVYERNERAVLRLSRPGAASSQGHGQGDGDGEGELLLVLVGASLVGGIELALGERSSWAGRERSHPVAVRWPVARGEEIAHFRFGSTVVVLLPAGATERFTLTSGQPLRMGQTIAAPSRLTPLTA